MTTTGSLLEDALFETPDLMSTPFGTSVKNFRESNSNQSIPFDVFVWNHDIKKGTHISVDTNVTPRFPPPMGQGAVRFFVCDSKSMEMLSVYATSTTYVKALEPKLGRFYMIPLEQLNDLLSEGIPVPSEDDIGDPMDVDDDGSAPQYQEAVSSVSRIRWMPTHPFSLEASRADHVMINVLGENYTDHIDGLLGAYLQFLKEVIAHLAVPTDRYRDNMSNFFMLYSEQYKFWTSMETPDEFPPEFYSLPAIPTLEETRMYLLKRAGYLFEQPACALICAAETALCGFQNLLAFHQTEVDSHEIIVAAISEFEDFTLALQRILNQDTLPGREWWNEITASECIHYSNEDEPRYRLPFELVLQLDTGLRQDRWPGLMDGMEPPSIRLSAGHGTVDQSTMLLYILPILRKLIVEDTLQINRALYYTEMGEGTFPGSGQLITPTRLEEARLRQTALDDARFAEHRVHHDSLPVDFIDESLAMKTDFDESAFASIPVLFPPVDWAEYRIFDIFGDFEKFFLVNLPKVPLNRWRFNDISHWSPSLRQYGFSVFRFDRKYTANLIREVTEAESHKTSGYDAWRTGEIARLVPDIEDFATDGNKANLLPPCLRALADLAPPKKTKGVTKLKNYHRLGAASTFLRIGYDPEQVISYMSDGTPRRTAEAQSVVRSHITAYFNGGDFMTANSDSMIYACEKLVENAKISPAATLHCPYAAKDKTLDVYQAAAQCSCDNLPNYNATQKTMSRKHPIFLLYERLKVAQLGGHEKT